MNVSLSLFLSPLPSPFSPPVFPFSFLLTVLGMKPWALRILGKPPYHLDNIPLASTYWFKIYLWDVNVCVCVCLWECMWRSGQIRESPFSSRVSSQGSKHFHLRNISQALSLLNRHSPHLKQKIYTILPNFDLLIIFQLIAVLIFFKFKVFLCCPCGL